MIFQELSSALHAAKMTLPVHTVTSEQRPNDVCNTTELKHAHISSLDCAGQPHTWEEAQIDVLVTGGEGLTVQKLLFIATASAKGLNGVNDATLSIDIDRGNGEGTQRFIVSGTRALHDRFEVRLNPTSTHCKVAAAFEGISVLPKRPQAKSLTRTIARYVAKKLAIVSAFAVAKPLIWPSNTACC